MQAGAASWKTPENMLRYRFEEARTALFRALDSRELFGVPLLVLANKQDLQDAQPPEAMQQMLGLDELKVPFRWGRGPVDSLTLPDSNVTVSGQSMLHIIKAIKY